jgi:hypothetical protein
MARHGNQEIEKRRGKKKRSPTASKLDGIQVHVLPKKNGLIVMNQKRPRKPIFLCSETPYMLLGDNGVAYSMAHSTKRPPTL